MYVGRSWRKGRPYHWRIAKTFDVPSPGSFKSEERGAETWINRGVNFLVQKHPLEACAEVPVAAWLALGHLPGTMHGFMRT